MRKIACERCLTRSVGLIADLPLERLDAFRACSASAIYRPRQVVFHEGVPAPGFYIVCHGAVRLYQSDRFGREYTIGIAEAGDIVGELPLDSAEPSSTSAETLVESQLCLLPRDALGRLLELHPSVGLRLVAALGSALGAARRRARDLALKSAESRLAGLLMQLAEGRGARSENGCTRVMLGFSRRELADMIGVSTETAIRLLSRLRDQRVVALERRELLVTDVERLQRIATRGDLDAEEAG